MTNKGKWNYYVALDVFYNMDYSNETQREWKCNGKVIMKMDEKQNYI